jgi:hypothetical protein
MLLVAGLRVQRPEGRLQAKTPEDSLCLLGGPPAKVRVQPVAIPKLREQPGLLKCERLATLTMLLPPCPRIFFRPEEQDIRSGKDQIVVPLAKRQREIDDASALNLTASDAYLSNLAGIGVGGLDLRVRMQRGRNAEHIPCAVGIIGAFPNVNVERRRLG